MTKVDGYEVGEPIGAGTFGTVFHAHQLDCGRDVALKVLHYQDHSSRLDLESFRNECRAMGILSAHPNVVTIYEGGLTEDGRFFISMELYRQSLTDRIRRAGKKGNTIDVADVLDIGARLLDGLTHAHDAGILHRDLKPQNVLLGRFGPGLADFGISYNADPGADSSAAGFTLSYAAPELLIGGQSSIQSDLYSLGATLYSALDGRRPYKRESDEPIDRLIERIIDEPLPPLANRNVSPEVEQLLSNLMAKDPATRPASAQQARSMIAGLQRGLQLAPTPSAEVGQLSSSEDAVEPVSIEAVDSDEETRTIVSSVAVDSDGRSVDGIGSRPAEWSDPTEQQSESRSGAPPSGRPKRAATAFAGLAGLVVAVLAAGMYIADGESGAQDNGPFDLPGATIATIDVSPLAPPDQLRLRYANEGGAPHLVLSWEPVDGASSYFVEISAGEKLERLTSTPELVLPPLGRDQIYVRVRAIGEGRTDSSSVPETCLLVPNTEDVDASDGVGSGYCDDPSATNLIVTTTMAAMNVISTTAGGDR